VGRASISPDGASWILIQLAGARGVSPAALPGNDVYQRLDGFAIVHLTDAQQVEALRLRAAVAEVHSGGRRKPRPKQRPERPQRLRDARQQQQRPTREHAKERPRTTSAASGRCALCEAVLYESERRASEADSALFLGHLCCAEHAGKLRAALRGS
jgi:hypothetical protein